MSVGVCPIRLRKDSLRSESTGYHELAFMLCWKPSVCPTSWASTYSSSRPISSSGKGNCRAGGRWPPPA